MHRTSRKFILLWTLMLTSIGAGMLWASAEPGWVQDRMFGPEASTEPVPGGATYMPDSYLLQRIDRQTNLRFEDRCQPGRFVVMYFEEYGSIWTSGEGTLVLDGNQLTTDLARDRLPPEHHTQRLTFDQLDEIWTALEQMRALRSPPKSDAELAKEADRQMPVVDPHHFYATIAACADGQSWYGSGKPQEEQPAVQTLERYLNPPPG